MRRRDVLALLGVSGCEDEHVDWMLGYSDTFWAAMHADWPSTKVLWCPPPVGEIRSEEVRGYHHRMGERAGEFVSGHANRILVPSTKYSMDPVLGTNDGYHPIDLGYQQMERNIAAALVKHVFA